MAGNVWNDMTVRKLFTKDMVKEPYTILIPNMRRDPRSA